MQSGIDKYNTSMKSIADQADQIRNIVRNHDKNTRYRAFTARHVYDFFRDRQNELVSLLTPIGLNVEDFFNRLGPDGLIKLFEDMPTTDIQMNLRNQRNNQFAKTIEPNDLNEQNW